METPILRIENISKRYGQKDVLKGASLEVNRGDLKILIGPSGAGKSTLLQCINFLVQPDEGRNAEVARDMKVAGAWLVPTYNGVDYLDKPAFYFKTVALSLATFGDNETAARVPSAAFGVALVVMVFAFGRKVHSTRAGLLAAIVVGTTPLFLANSRTVIFDIALAFFVCGAIFAGYLAEEAEGRTRRNWYLLGAAAVGDHRIGREDWLGVYEFEGWVSSERLNMSCSFECELLVVGKSDGRTSSATLGVHTNDAFRFDESAWLRGSIHADRLRRRLQRMHVSLRRGAYLGLQQIGVCAPAGVLGSGARKRPR